MRSHHRRVVPWLCTAMPDWALVNVTVCAPTTPPTTNPLTTFAAAPPVSSGPTAVRPRLSGRVKCVSVSPHGQTEVSFLMLRQIRQYVAFATDCP